ncbi:MAG TPA: uridine kinase [Methylomirabilota bacterium]
MTNPYLVGIAGGTGAGKTALVEALATTLGVARVARLAQDAYYRDRSDLAPDERAALNFDVPDALDLDLFHADLTALHAGRPVAPPQYCFTTHRRLGFGEPLDPREIVLVEGILLFAEPDTRPLFDLRIFLDAPAHLRLARRIARDTVERGRTPASVAAQCQATTWPAHAQYVEPTRACAELVLINTGPLHHVAAAAATAIRAGLEQRAPSLI